MVFGNSEITVCRHRTERYAALIGAAIIALGYTPAPLIDPASSRAAWYDWSIALLSLMPIAVLALAVASRRKLPTFVAVVFAPLLVLCVGVFIILAILSLSGVRMMIVGLHGTSLILACTACILLVSNIGQRAKLLIFGMYLIPVFVGIWSLASVPIAYASALKISSNRAFCIGEHDPIQRELGSIIALRGLSFYTTRFGYKTTDTWYFHRLLLIEDNGKISVFNWSPRYMEFQTVERPELQFVSPFEACEPTQNFLQELALFQ